MRWAALLLLWVCAPASAQDAAWSAERLQLTAAELIGPNAARRAELVHVLSHLGVDAREAIATRLAALMDTQPSPELVTRTLDALHALSEDPVLGVPALLAHEQNPRLLAVVEPLLYLRSLETMHDALGLPLLASFVELDAGAWESELLQVSERLSVSLAPALLGMRAHPSAAVRRFAQAQLTALGIDEPQRLLANDDPQLVARALRAYANPPDLVALPAIVPLVADARLQVREAAREAVSCFGPNASPALRALYEARSGQRADKSWDEARTTRELYAVLDRPRLETSLTLLARGERALATRDLASVQRDYDALLAKDPSFAERAELAPGYAALAADLFRRDALEASLAAWQRAIWLAPQAVEARQWAAQVAFVSAELALLRGVVDLAAYRQAIALDPQLSAARAAYARWSATRVDSGQDQTRLAVVGGVLLLAAAAIGLWRVIARSST